MTTENKSSRAFHGKRALQVNNEKYSVLLLCVSRVINGCRWKTWRLLFYGQISPKRGKSPFFLVNECGDLSFFPHKIKQKHFFLEEKYETIPCPKKEAAVDVFLIFPCFVKMHKFTLHHMSYWSYLCLLSSLHMDQDLLLVLGWFKMKIFLNFVSCLQLHNRLSYERSDIFLCTHTPLNDLLMKKMGTWRL